jgi:hypothetical protein
MDPGYDNYAYATDGTQAPYPHHDPGQYAQYAPPEKQQKARHKRSLADTLSSVFVLLDSIVLLVFSGFALSFFLRDRNQNNQSFFRFTAYASMSLLYFLVGITSISKKDWWPLQSRMILVASLSVWHAMELIAFVGVVTSFALAQFIIHLIFSAASVALLTGLTCTLRLRRTKGNHAVANF